MAPVRSLVYALAFYAVTAVWVLAGIVASLFGRGATRAVVLSWVDLHHWLVEQVLDIRVRVEGRVPKGPHLIAVKHQSMLETLEMVRLTHLPVIVIKRELADIPLFGWMTRRYGVIPVERSAGAKALRKLVEEGRRSVAEGRSVIIYPEGTRVPVGRAPALKSGFSALYRALGLPVVPVAVDSGQLWGRGFIHRSGTVTLRIGETIPSGLKREEIEARVHASINVFELASEARA
ncbi:MAG TPA: lysophospholipid acyltransferase family protein [Sphingomicrobium sp.]|nr:lysophospholipid acyltransferase family protein [Sphingomicrobium sp.]